MKYKQTFLNSIAYIFLCGCIVFIIFNYENLTEAEGWGMVAMLGLLLIGITGLIIDQIIQIALFYYRNKKDGEN